MTRDGSNTHFQAFWKMVKIYKLGDNYPLKCRPFLNTGTILPSLVRLENAPVRKLN